MPDGGDDELERLRRLRRADEEITGEAKRRAAAIYLRTVHYWEQTVYEIERTVGKGMAGRVLGELNRLFVRDIEGRQRHGDGPRGA